MATSEEIAAFRLLVDESADKLPYDDISISSRLDTASSPEALATQIWREKAARYASLVNVSESGSSRNLSDLHDHALKMAAVYANADATAPGGAAVRGVRMMRLTR